jgi:proteasome lid subunit RPN8/RPN11
MNSMAKIFHGMPSVIRPRHVSKMPISISPLTIEQIKAHCIYAYPHECCGALIGVIKNGEKMVTAGELLTNAEPHSPERRFVIDPVELNTLERKSRANGHDIVGFYHSHPDAPARPSSTDREWAWPVYSYVIVSVEKGEIADIRSYELDENQPGSPFAEELININV